MPYTVATLVQKDAPIDTKTRLVIRFTGAGETAVEREFFVDGATTLTGIRQWCISEASRLGNRRTVADGLTVGQSINLTPIAPPAPTAKQIWQEKAARYAAYKDLGLTAPTFVAELAALQTDLNNTYAAGFLDA